MNPFQVVREFEAALCAYTGAPYAVAVTSCTAALLLAVRWHLLKAQREAPTLVSVEIPKRTYISVPMSIIHAGGRPTFRDEEWIGYYQLKPLPVWDSARWFRSGMYESDFEVDGRGERRIGFNHSGKMLCVSFHASKILSDTQGGAILHDSPEADIWLRKARFDGRTEGVHPNDDHFGMLGYHCYLSPDVAARLLWKLSVLPKHNEPLPPDQYPDLSLAPIFR